MKYAPVSQTKSVFFLTLLFILPSTLMAQPKSYIGESLQVFEVMDNSNLVVFIKGKDIQETPAWQPSEGEPPLNLASLFTKVKAWVKTDNRLSKYKINEVELKRINHHREHWYYLVQLKSSDHSINKLSYLAVLLNGKIVPAMAEPSSIK